MTEEAECIGYALEEVSVFSCGHYHPGTDPKRKERRL
jgi:hypothetical protein